MVLTCSSCGHQIYLDDAKIPDGTFKVRCTKCSKIITSERKQDQPSEDIPPLIQQYVKSQIDALKAELSKQQEVKIPQVSQVTLQQDDDGEDFENEGNKHALICEADAAILTSISSALEKMNYAVDTARTAGDALKKIDSGAFDLVLVGTSFPDDKDGLRKIVGRINGQKSLQRRQTFLVIVSAQHKTSDQSAAFMLGANWIIHKSDLARFAPVLSEGQQYFRQLYHLFNRVLDERNRQI
jgi:predicted Zn finger-like uncharacterized protein